ncbi:MAG: DNA-binding protein [Christensenellaceae bacterium]|nr:DNA-binding protein [Christensenellaceae bacterium]
MLAENTRYGFHEIKIKSGENIREIINAYVVEHKITHAFIAGAVGSVSDMVFNAPDSSSFPIKPVSTPVSGPAEVLAFSGEVIPKEEMDETMKRIYHDDPYDLFIHVHAAVGVAGANVYGGALLEGKVFRALSVYILPINPIK